MIEDIFREKVIQKEETVPCPTGCGHVLNPQEIDCLKRRGVYKCPVCLEMMGFENDEVFYIKY